MTTMQIENQKFAGYKELLKNLYGNDWKFRNNPELYIQAESELTDLLSDSTRLSDLVDNVDNALEQALDARYRFILQHVFGLRPVLAEPKNDAAIGKIAPRVDGGVGLTRNQVRIMRVKGLARLFNYQRFHPIAGLSFNP